MQVLSNLLSNALKFTKEGTIAITTDKRYNEVIVKVRDSGSGIDSEIFPRLFEKFASKSEKGTGLGLFISKNITEAHGGRIWAENNPDGKGATFIQSAHCKPQINEISRLQCYLTLTTDLAIRLYVLIHLIIAALYFISPALLSDQGLDFLLGELNAASLVIPASSLKLLFCASLL